MTKKIQLNFAIFVLAFIILGSILAPLLATHNPFEPDMANRLQSPCWQHFFGTVQEYLSSPMGRRFGGESA